MISEREWATYRTYTINTFYINSTLRKWNYVICRVFLLLPSPAWPGEHAPDPLSFFLFGPPFRIIRKQFINYDFDPMISDINTPSKFLYRVIENNLSKMAAGLERESTNWTERCHASTGAHWDRLWRSDNGERKNEKEKYVRRLCDKRVWYGEWKAV